MHCTALKSQTLNDCCSYCINAQRTSRNVKTINDVINYQVSSMEFNKRIILTGIKKYLKRRNPDVDLFFLILHNTPFRIYFNQNM